MWRQYSESFIKASPAVYGIQLCLQHSLVLLYDIPQRNGHMFPVLALCAVQTHGCLTRLAVELHHLQRETNWVDKKAHSLLLGVRNLRLCLFVFFTWIIAKSWWFWWGVSWGFSPFPRGLGSWGASLQLQHWLTPEHCRPPAVSTRGLVEGPGRKHFFIQLFFSDRNFVLFQSLVHSCTSVLLCTLPSMHSSPVPQC